MRIATKGSFIRIGAIFGVVGIALVSFWAGRESGTGYGYNRGYLYGYFACRQSDMIMNSTVPGEIHIPQKQFIQENEAFAANERRYQLAAFNDRYLDPAVIRYDNFVIHTSSTRK